MIYTAKNRDELLEQIQEYLKRDDVREKVNDETTEDYKLMYVLMKKFDPKETVVAASNERGETILFFPFSEDEEVCDALDFDPDWLLFYYLENQYEIIEFDFDTHSDVWFCVNEFGGTSIIFPEGFQQYLEYCLKNNVTAAQMRENFDYDGVDLLTMYKAEGKEDLFMHVENFKDKPWYGDIVLFTRIGTCKPKAEHVPEVCKALNQLGYSVRLKTKDGELYVLPAKDKKPKEMEAR
jgi:hypothetical protein